MTESEFQLQVEAECERLRLVWHHCTQSKRCRGTNGLPDLIIAGPSGVIFRELKSEDGETSAGQDLWGWTLTRAWPSLWSVWRPADLDNGTIRFELECLCS